MMHMTKNRVPQCKECEYHKAIPYGKKGNGLQHNHDCTATNRRIEGFGPFLSPKWCPKRTGEKIDQQEPAPRVDTKAPAAEPLIPPIASDKRRIEPRTLRLLRCQAKLDELRIKYNISPEDWKELKLNLVAKIFI
jgi:hypothetical protein